MTGKAKVNGVELWYEVTGEGEPVIQIHGAGFGHFNFAPATPGLAEHFQVIDYDMRGYGQSDRPVQRYDMEVWADDAAGLLDAPQVLGEAARRGRRDDRRFAPRRARPALLAGPRDPDSLGLV